MLVDFYYANGSSIMLIFRKLASYYASWQPCLEKHLATLHYATQINNLLCTQLYSAPNKSNN